MPHHISQRQPQKTSWRSAGLFSYIPLILLIWRHQTTISFQNWNNFEETNGFRVRKSWKQWYWNDSRWWVRSFTPMMEWTNVFHEPKMYLSEWRLCEKMRIIVLYLWYFFVIFGHRAFVFWQCGNDYCYWPHSFAKIWLR